MENFTGTIGITALLAKCVVFIVMLVFWLTACASSDWTPSGNVTLQQLLEEVGLSADGGRMRVRELVPQEGVTQLGRLVQRSAPFRTGDGYQLGPMVFNYSQQGEVGSFGFRVAEGPCMPLEAVPGFEHARLRPPAIPNPPVPRSPWLWSLSLPEATVLVTPRLEDESCLEGVQVYGDRRDQGRVGVRAGSE